MKKRLLALLMATTMVISLFAGCGTPSTGEEEGSSDASEGKVFRYASTTEPTTLDPSKGNCIPDNEIQHAITESVVRNTAGKVEPGIAESWDYDETTFTYTFHLRDAVWSDGEPITANDFVYGWQRLMDPATASPYAFIGEYIKNGVAVETGEMAVEELAVSAPDEKTFVVQLEANTPFFLSLVGSSGQFAPIRKDIVEQYGTDFAATYEKNVYSGPFVLTASSGGEYVFEKNENYWNADAIKLDKVVQNIVETTDTQLAMYEDGELDYVEVPSSYVPEYKDQALEVISGNVDYLYVNHAGDNEALLNQNFRLALNYALNRNEYIALAINNVYRPTNRLSFTGLTGVNGGTYGEEYALDSYPLEGDADTAKKYLDAAMAELGVSDPSEIVVELTCFDSEGSKKQGEVLQELFQKSLGITVEIRQVAYAEVYGTVIPTGDYELIITGWGADYDDPYSYLQLFKSTNVYNDSKYNNPDFDAVLTKAENEVDPVTRMGYLAEAEQILIDTAAWVPLQERAVYKLIDEDVTGLEFYYCSVNIDFVYADIAE